MAFCSNCGMEINSGAKFCSGCGKSINGTTELHIPVQQQNIKSEQSSGNNQIIKQGLLSYDKSLVKALKGVATLYNDRLEWKGELGMNVVINISEILNTEISRIKQALIITLVNAQKHSFSKTLTGGDIAKQVAFGFLGSGKIISELSEWQAAIKISMGRK